MSGDDDLQFAAADHEADVAAAGVVAADHRVVQFAIEVGNRRRGIADVPEYGGAQVSEHAAGVGIVGHFEGEEELVVRQLQNSTVKAA